MSGALKLAIIAAVVAIELAIGVPLAMLAREPMYPLILLAALILMSVIVAGVVMAVNGRRYSGTCDHNNLLEPWMHSNMYFNNQAMRRDLDRMTQLSEQQAWRNTMRSYDRDDHS